MKLFFGQNGRPEERTPFTHKYVTLSSGFPPAIDLDAPSVVDAVLLNGVQQTEAWTLLPDNETLEINLELPAACVVEILGYRLNG